MMFVEPTSGRVCKQTHERAWRRVLTDMPQEIREDPVADPSPLVPGEDPRVDDVEVPALSPMMRPIPTTSPVVSVTDTPTRAQFGVTLLERNSRNVRLTDAGDGISYEGCEAARSGRERCCRQSG
jgi:hypothetical protein